MRRLALLTTVAGISLTLLVHGAANSEEDEQDNVQKNVQDGRVDRSPTQPSTVARSRSVYKVDDVGMIIGGASEDAKAKVGRLPIRE